VLERQVINNALANALIPIVTLWASTSAPAQQHRRIEHIFGILASARPGRRHPQPGLPVVQGRS
jgi:hypothetical protein